MARLYILFSKPYMATGSQLGDVMAVLQPEAWQWVRRGSVLRLDLGSAPAGFQIRALRDMGEWDFILRPTKSKPIKLLLCDMDSTIIQQECIDELADQLGLKEKVAAITEAAMRGELDFPTALRERVAMLQGLPEASLQEVYDKRIRLTKGATELVAAVKKKKGRTVLVSGGFTFFTSRVAGAVGFDEHYANQLEIAEGRLTGRVIEPILGKEAKLEILQAKQAELKLETAQVMAVGDGANDIPMLEAAGFGVAYHAKPAVQNFVSQHINHGDLRGLSYCL